MNFNRLIFFRQRWCIFPLYFVYLIVWFWVFATIWLIIQQPTIGFLGAAFLIVLSMSIILLLRRNGIIFFKHMVMPILALAILAPYIQLPEAIPDLRLEIIIILVIWELFFLNHTAGKSIPFFCCPTYKWFGLLGLSIISSISYATLAKGQPLIWRDFWEIIKLIVYFLTFSLVINLNIEVKELKRCYIFALFIFMISALVGFLQYINFGSINKLITPYYAPIQITGVLKAGRITGTTSNPNEFGALMVAAISLALSGALFFQEKRVRMLCYCTIPVFALALVFTLSRSSLIAVLLSGATILFISLRQKTLKHRFRRGVLLVLLGCVITALIFQLLPERSLFRFAQLKNLTTDASWQGRIENWQTHFALWTKSPWFGWGPGKATMGSIVDNEWLLFLRRYGILGVLIFLSFFGSLFFGLSHIRNVNSETSVITLSVALQGILVGYVLYMTVAAIYHSLQLMLILLLFLGLAYSQWRPKRSKRKVINENLPITLT